MGPVPLLCALGGGARAGEDPALSRVSPADWLRQALSRRPKEKPASQDGSTSDAPPPSPRAVLCPASPGSAAPCPALAASSQGAGGSASGSASGGTSDGASSGATGMASGRASGGTSGETSGGTGGGTSGSASGGTGGGTGGGAGGGRWGRDYDVCVCHSEGDLAAAQELVAYLEGSPAGLRCFLQLRDAAPGGAIVSELCRALDGSHCRVLLITPGFLSDPWCRYQMLQALSQAPGAEGRTIPLLSGLARAAYPAELRFMYFVDGRGPDGGFRQVKEAVLRCKPRQEGKGRGQP